jgi:hypothetical protein
MCSLLYLFKIKIEHGAKYICSNKILNKRKKSRKFKIVKNYLNYGEMNNVIIFFFNVFVTNLCRNFLLEIIYRKK